MIGCARGACDAQEIAVKARRPAGKDLLEGAEISFRVAGHDLLVGHTQSPLVTTEPAARYGADRNRGLRVELWGPRSGLRSVSDRRSSASSTPFPTRRAAQPSAARKARGVGCCYVRTAQPSYTASAIWREETSMKKASLEGIAPPS